MEDQTDEMLMKELTMGNTLAFDKLYERYSDKIYGFMVFKLKNNVGTVEDIHQIVWEKVYKRAHTFKTTEKFSSWIFKITRNAIIDELRKSSRQDQLIKSLEEEESFLKNDKKTILIPIESLKPPYREALEMRYLRNMEIRDIAKILNIKETNTRKVISRGLKKLRVILGRS